MDKEFIPYEQALELKELGFDEPCFGYYGNSEEDSTIVLELRTISQEGDLAKRICSAPLYQQAFRWFREKHNLFVNFPIDQTSKPKFCYHIVEYYEDEVTWEWKDNWGWSFLYRTYEEAEIECLKKLIEIVKQKL
jgi:hypothetical protein